MTWLIVIGCAVLFFLWAVFAHPAPADRQWVLDNTCPVKQTRAVCNPTGIVWELHQSR